MAVVNSIQFGVVTTLKQNVVYAIPAKHVVLFTDATSPTIVQSTTAAFTASIAVTLDTNNQAEIIGAFIKCTSGDIGVIIKSYAE